MSGGRFNYADRNLKDEIFGWGPTPKNIFEDKEISLLVWDVLDLVHEYDWYASGDNAERHWLEAKAAFKKKWLSDSREYRIKSIIDSSLDELREELYKSFEILDDVKINQLMSNLIVEGDKK